MKATDLMLGDWVTLADALKAGVFYPIKITSLTLPDRIAGYHPHPAIEGSDVYGEDDLVGIPLTPEILEKNGWELISNPPYKLEYFWSTGAIEEYADIRIYVGKDHNDIWRWDFQRLNIHLYRGDIELTKLRFVHELQHALRLCGIEKEIEL